MRFLISAISAFTIATISDCGVSALARPDVLPRQAARQACVAGHRGVGEVVRHPAARQGHDHPGPACCPPMVGPRRWWSPPSTVGSSRGQSDTLTVLLPP